MRRTVRLLGRVVAFSLPLCSCHPPTWSAQEEYAHSKRCFAALDTNSKLVTAAGFRQAGINPDAVDFVSRENTDGAYNLGKEIGMSPRAIDKDLERARAAYLKSHTWQPAGRTGRKFVALGNEVNDCLLDYYGRPND